MFRKVKVLTLYNVYFIPEYIVRYYYAIIPYLR